MRKRIIILGNNTDWLSYSLKDFSKQGVKIINSLVPYSEKNFLYKIMHLHFSYNLNKVFQLPFKSIWFKRFCGYINNKYDEEFVLIVYDRNRLANNVKFLKYLKKKYKNIKLVYVFTNIVKFSGARENNFVEKLNDFYDIVYAFDPTDAPKYGFRYHPLIYSRNGVNNLSSENNKVFYVGKSKDRFTILIDIYEKLKELGIAKRFYIFGVDKEKQKYPNEIHYNEYISYKECLDNIKASKCILDVVQGDSEGFTIKVCEAVFYNKLLITTNKKVVDAPFYDPRYILVIDSVEDIKKEFIENRLKVNYPDEGRYIFSTGHFVKKMYNDLYNGGDGEKI